MKFYFDLVLGCRRLFNMRYLLDLFKNLYEHIVGFVYFLRNSGGQSGWVLGWVVLKAFSSCSSWFKRTIVGYGLRSTLYLQNRVTVFKWFGEVKTYESYLLALRTCGTRQRSAMVSSSPTQNWPADWESIFSRPWNPWLIQCCAHFKPWSLPIWSRTAMFCSGWIPEHISSTISRTFALFTGSLGRRASWGRVSSR